MTFNGQLFSFITQVSGRINRLEELALQDGLQEPVTIAEIKIIHAVGVDGSEKMGNIASLLGITLATLTVACDKLEARGFISRRRDHGDKRTVSVSLTAKGLVAYRFHASYGEGLIDLILGELTEDERVVLRKCIFKLNTFFEQIVEDDRGGQK